MYTTQASWETKPRRGQELWSEPCLGLYFFYKAWQWAPLCSLILYFTHSCLLVLWTGTITETVLALCVLTKALIHPHYVYLCDCTSSTVCLQLSGEIDPTMKLNDALTVRQMCMKKKEKKKDDSPQLIFLKVMTYFSQAAVINTIQTGLPYQSKWTQTVLEEAAAIDSLTVQLNTALDSVNWF